MLHLWFLYRPGSPEAGPAIFPHADKVMHFVGFAAPTGVAVLAARAWWPVAVFALHAPVSEVIQALAIELRSGDPWDVAADLAGVAAGAALAWWFRRDPA